MTINNYKKCKKSLWERGAQVRASVLRNPGKPWGSWADSTFSLAGNWSKIGVDHMFDHNWKISYPGVAQLVARLLWEQDAGSSSLPTRTRFIRKTAILGGFSALLRLFLQFWRLLFCDALRGR